MIIGFPDVRSDLVIYVAAVYVLIDISGCDLFCMLCLPSSLCIILRLHSESAIISEIVVTSHPYKPLDSTLQVQICSRQTALTSIQMTTKSRA